MRMEMTLKIIGIFLNVIAAGILAYRITRIVNAISASLNAHEANIQQIMSALDGYQGDLFHFKDSVLGVDKAQKLGTGLLIFGFTLMVIGNGLIALSTWISFSS